MQEARRRSGRLGGRPPKPTHDEAREDAPRRLVPRALQKLEEQLDSDDQRIAQTAALRILEWDWGKPTAPVEDVTERPPEFLIWKHPGVEAAAKLKATLEERERLAFKPHLKKALPVGEQSA